jgi:beta-glucosidase
MEKRAQRWFDNWYLHLILMLVVAAMPTAMPAAAAGPQYPSKLTAAEVNQQVNAMLAKLTLEEKIKLIGGVDGMFTHAMPQIGLPRLKMSDGPVGVRVWGPSIAYAGGIGLAASWDTTLARKVGAALGQDARARGVNILLGPGVDMYRAPMNGRNFEYFGEDPFLASQIAVGYIEGVQSQDVVATIKHYAVNDAEYDRMQENAIVGQRALREIYLPVFEAAVKQAHVGAFMDAYNRVNGEYCTANKFLNTDVLRKDWGFGGILMSDWGAAHDGIADANAGLDLEMPRARYMNAATLLPAIREGKVSEATIDEKVRRILRVAVEFGFINHDQTDLHLPLYNLHSLDVALQSAEESIVLLKNEGNLLPLDRQRIHSIALIGPDAYPAVASAGGSAHVTAIAPVSDLQGLAQWLGPSVKVYWNSGLKTLDDVFGPSGPRFFFQRFQSRFTTDKEGQHPGLTQEEFDSGSFTGKPDRVSVVPNLNHWDRFVFARPSQKKLAVRWTGYYTPKVSGRQRFVVAAAGLDSFHLYVNGKDVLEAGPGQAQDPESAVVDLPAGGPAAVRLDYLPQTNRIRASFGVIPAKEMLEPNVRKIAAMADVAILAVGFDPRTEGEGHDRTFKLPPGQDDLIRAVEAANPHTIVLLTSGGSVDTSGWLDRAPAFLETWYGGSEAGLGLARVLFGHVNPSGKLPISWERRVQDNPTFQNYYEEPGTHDVHYKEGIFVGYRYYDQSKVKPLFPFGFGLSYTTFAFSHLSVTPKVASPDGPIRVSFDVQNTGQRAGAEVAQVYVGDPSATAPRPVKELKAFDRVFLKPGESQHVSFTLNRRSLAYWDVRSKGWKVDPGKFVIYAGDSDENVPLQQDFTVR